MAEYGVFSNAEIFAGGYRLSGLSNAVAISANADLRDRSCFGDLGRVRGFGLETADLSVSGFMDVAAGSNEEFIRNAWDNVSTVPLSLFIPSVSGAAVAIGDPAYFFQGRIQSYSIGGQHGADLPFSMQAQSVAGYPLALGNVLSTGLAAVTADGSTTPTLLVAADVATKYIYAILHVISITAGDTVDITIESDELVGFGSPTVRATFAQVSAASGLYLTRVAGGGGAAADTYWRATHNVTDAGGGGVSVTYACAMAIA